MWNRPIMTGLVTEEASRDKLQQSLNQFTTSSFQFYEVRSNDPASHFYTMDRSFPVLDAKSAYILSVQYYDTYDIDEDGRDNYTLFNIGNSNPLLVDYKAPQGLQGISTITKERVLNDDNYENHFLTYVSFFDYRGRMVQNQVYGENYRQYGYVELTTTQYDFSGKVLKTLRQHKYHPREGTKITVHKDFDYDHAGRLLTVDQRIESSEITLSQTPTRLVGYEYNELGQVTKKSLHRGQNTGFAQNIDFKYNQRGWLTHINDTELTENSDLFAMQLDYFCEYDGFHNGNIWKQHWASRTDEQVRNYEYDYDGLNRILKAEYSNPDNLEENYNLDYVSYDLNGNIIGLQRHGLVALERENENLIKRYDLIDKLDYNYGNQSETYSNRLLAVNDEIVTNGVANDFNDFGNYGSKEYDYDLNGNMIADGNKGIKIEYNHINLPHTINFSEGQKIRNSYLAAGSKIRTERITSKGTSTYTDYVQEFVYENDTLRFFPMEEGRVVFEDNGKPKLEYHYKDHLGNLRLAFEVEEINVSFLLTMEADSAQKEEEQFENVAEARTDLKDKEGHYSAALTGANKAISKTIEVKKGDQIKASVFATHDPTIADTDPAKAIADAKKDVLLSLGAAAAGTINTNPTQQEVEIPLNPEITPATTKIIKAPRVRLNVLDFVPVIRNLRALNRAKKAKVLEPDMYYVPKGELVLELRDSTDSLIFEKREKLTISAAVSWEKLVSDVEINQDGNLTVYIDNSSSDKVYFDYLEINNSIAHATVIQENHYYPFGMNMKGIEELDLQSLDNEDEHRWQYNGKEKEESFGLYWNDYGWRNMDTQLGRFTRVDRFAEKYYSSSSYNYALNNPISNIDIMGDSVEFDKNEQKQVITMKVTGKILNASHRDVDMEKAKTEIEEDMRSKYQGSIQVDGKDYTFETKIELKIIKSLDELENSDHLVVLADNELEQGFKDIKGTVNQIGGKVMVIDANDFTTNGFFSSFFASNTRTALHEFGHLLGLKHVDGFNLMKSGGSGTILNSIQLQAIYEDRRFLNQGVNYERHFLTKTRVFVTTLVDPYSFKRYNLNYFSLKLKIQ